MAKATNMQSCFFNNSIGQKEMKKTFKLEDLDCALCAAKIEDAIRKIEGVRFVSVNFIGQKLTLEADDVIFDEVLKKAVKAAKKAEPDCRIES